MSLTGRHDSQRCFVRCVPGSWDEGKWRAAFAGCFVINKITLSYFLSIIFFIFTLLLYTEKKRNAVSTFSNNLSASSSPPKKL